jgi:hypothetical protein
MNPNSITSIIHPKFVCGFCNFECSKKGDYNRHISTDKNKILTNPNSLASKNITFNLNFYLNETCKDAMDISDFVSSIKMSLLVISLYFLY